MELSELVKIYKLDNLRHAKCTFIHHDEYGHLCEELIELKAAINSNNMLNTAEELADVWIIAAIYANKLNIDLAGAVERKTLKNYQNGRLATLDTTKFTSTSLPQFDQKSET